MSGDRGACGACSVDLSPENSSRLRSGKVVHIGCPGAVSESRLSLTGGEPVKAEVPASPPAEIAPITQPRKGRRMSIGGGPPVVGVDVGSASETAVAFVAADGRLLSSRVGGAPKGDGFEVLGPRDIFAVAFASKPVAGQRTPDAAEEARRKAESEARMKVPGPRAEADRRGLSAHPPAFEAVAEWARVAGEAWKEASAKMVTAFEGVKLPMVRDLSDALQVPDETASAEPDDFEPPEHCSVCGKPKSKRLGLVLSTGTHLRCKAAQIRAQAEEAEAELKAEKEGLAEDLAEKEAEVKHADAQLEAVTEHPEIGDLARDVVDSVPSPETALRRKDEQLALSKEPPSRSYLRYSPELGAVEVISPAREPGELIHFFGLQEFGAYPFGKDRPAVIVALCGQKTAAKTFDLEPTVARLDEAKNVPKNANCLLCVRKWSPENRVFPAYVKPSQWQDLKSATPQAEPYVSPATRTGSRARSPRAGR